MKIAFFGTPRFAQIVLEKLIASPYKPSLVITAPDAKVGRGQTLQMSPVKKTALQNKIELSQPHNLLDENLKCDLAILAAYGKIVPKGLLSVPKYGFLNVHPSLLPKYRGPSPIHSAILEGDKKTGVSIILLDEEVDHGPVLDQSEAPIDPQDTHDTLAEKLAAAGASLLIKSLPEYLDDSLKPKPQDHSRATFTKHINKNDGHIDLEKPPDPQTFDRMIRAFHSWPGVFTELRFKNKDLRIKLLPGGKIQPQGKRAMSIKEFKNGYPQLYEQISQLFSNQAQN